jgi:hypothetical protein
MPYTHKRPQSPKEPHTPAAFAVLRDEFEAKEFGIVGEWATPKSEHVPAPPPAFRPPPPPWSVNYEPALDPDHEPAIELPSEEDER